LITCASFLGDNMRPVYDRIAAYLGAECGVDTDLLPGMDWGEQNRLLAQGQIEVAFLCGLPYTKLHDQPGAPLTLLAAPVMQAERYEDRPIYYTDVIVRTESGFTAFGDLRGAVWAYNGADSNSGYNMPRDYLLARGETNGFFGRTIESGSHQRSIEMVLDGAAEASGIDSIVLEMEMHLRPEAAAGLRVIEAIGPCPVPPVVAASALPGPVQAALRGALLTMHCTAAGRAILRDGLIARFAEVDDAYYNPIRDMARRAQQAGFVTLS
jgi:phosphate/phosphite/phosphonate ABC transporter binding protein